MSKFLKAIGLTLALGIASQSAAAEKFGLGRAATPDEVAAWDIDVRPDGMGLPEGSGSVATGEQLFTDHCAVCHGDFGEGIDRWPVLAGGKGTLKNDRPVKTIGSFWPYLSTVWDYVHRAMPFGNAQSLSADDVYALTAYILYLNDVVGDDFTLSKKNFLDVHLPNEANFVPDDRETTAVYKSREACMQNCKPAVKITKRAAVLDVTPESGGVGASLEGNDSSDAKAKADPQAPSKPEKPPASTVPTPAQVAAAPAPVQVAAAPAAPAKPALDPALVAAGETVFKKCKACHQVGDNAKNRVGPQLNGIVGAKVGSVEGFRYSNALQAMAGSGVVWDAAALDAFLAKPRDWAKGTKMSFVGLKDANDRAAVIEYLKSNSQ